MIFLKSFNKNILFLCPLPFIYRPNSPRLVWNVSGRKVWVRAAELEAYYYSAVTSYLRNGGFASTRPAM